jgi:hypothetical protein
MGTNQEECGYDPTRTKFFYFGDRLQISKEVKNPILGRIYPQSGKLTRSIGFWVLILRAFPFEIVFSDSVCFLPSE